jgi:hypothetical protein
MSKDGIGGTKDRIWRVGQRQSGQWRTVSSDLVFLASKMYKLSEQEAKSSHSGKTSQMVFAGIPLLVASIYALIIECESLGVLGPPAVDPMAALSKVLKTRYGVSGELLKDFQCLCEVRNEILHPIPLPTGTADNWPNYLRRIKEKKLLVEHPDSNVHYTFFDQLASHDLFAWSVYVTYGVYQALISYIPNRGMMLEFFLTTFGNFAQGSNESAKPENS